MWLSMADGLPYGVVDPVRVYTVSWAEVQWDGETGHAYLERSAMTESHAR
jgi:RES domain-containing protein